MHTLL